MKFEVRSFDLKINSVPLSMLLKVHGLTLDITEYENHYCAHCGIDYHGRGVTGSIIGFGKTPFGAMREMVYSLNEHASNSQDWLTPTRPYENSNTKRFYIDYLVTLDWSNLKDHFPKNLKAK
jgi:hypothetical protein